MSISIHPTWRFQLVGCQPFCPGQQAAALLRPGEGEGQLVAFPVLVVPGSATGGTFWLTLRLKMIAWSDSRGWVLVVVDWVEAFTRSFYFAGEGICFLRVVFCHFRFDIIGRDLTHLPAVVVKCVGGNFGTFIFICGARSVPMIQQCCLAWPSPSTTYQYKSLPGAVALLVQHEPRHQARKEIERRGGLSRRLNHWHGGASPEKGACLLAQLSTQPPSSKMQTAVWSGHLKMEAGQSRNIQSTASVPGC